MADRIRTGHNQERKLQLPLQYLKNITDNFSSDRQIGRGGFGVVYKGIDQSGAVMAVKKLRPILGAPDKQFKNEANNLARVDHRNIVKLIGYCDETNEGLVYDEYQKKYVVAEMQEKLLCYEYLPKGSLDRIIFDESRGLEWQDRYKIIVGICQGLYYLHEGMDNTPIIHMDLKPSNILLDDRMEPKIADFGLSRLFSEDQSVTSTENLMGSIGYMAPEYWDIGEISTKTDIYSLGILILEIITGKKNHQVMTNKSGEHFIKDVRKIWTHMSQKPSKNSSLGADCLQQVHRCIEIGLWCVEADKERRPSSGQLLWRILSAGGYTHKVDEASTLQGKKVVTAEKIDRKSLWSLTKMALKIAIGTVALVLVLLNLSRPFSWVVITSLRFVRSWATLIAIGAAAVVLVLYVQKNLSSSWQRRVILFVFAIGVVLAPVLILLNTNNPWTWVVSILKVVTALVFTTFSTGIAIIALVLCVLQPSEFWCQWVVLFSTGVVLSADVLVLLNPSGSWSCVLMTLQLLKTLVTLSAIGIVGVVLVFCLLNLSSTWQRVILFSIGALLAVVVLRNASSAWPWVVIAMKFVTALVALFLVGMLVAYLIHCAQNLSSSWRLVILLSIGPVLSAVLILLDVGNPWSWVVIMILKFVVALVTLFEIGIAVVYLVLCLLNLSGSRRRMVLFPIGVVLSTSLVLLNPTSPWSWLIMTLKVVMAAVILFPAGVLAIYLILHVLNIESFTLWVIYFLGMNYGLRFLSLFRDISRSCCGRGSPESR